MPSFGTAWGIDVGDSALKAVKLKTVGKQVALLDFQVVRYADVAGEPGARRENSLPQAIAALRSAGAGAERCVVSIAPQLVFNRFISLPPVDRRRIPEIVLYEARQQIPFNLNEVVWAYEALHKEFVPGEEIEIGLFAVKREVIDAYLAELTPLWKQLRAIQVGPLGLYNFIRHEVAVARPTVVIDVGAQSTNLLILDGQRFWLRNLPIAGNSFTTVLEKRLNISRSEAEKLKCGIADSRHRRRLLEVIRPVMRDLVAEVQRSIGYYKSLSQTVKFEEILVTGEGYKLFGLDRYLAEQLQYQIVPMQELKNIVYQGDAERAKDLGAALPSLGVAIGLALQGLGRAPATINLLPEDFVVRRELRGKRLAGLVAAALIWGIVLCAWLKQTSALAQMKTLEGVGVGTLNQVNALNGRLISAQQAEEPGLLKAYQAFGAHRQYFARIVGAISAVVPREFQLDRFTFVTPIAYTPSAGGRGGPPPPSMEAGAMPGFGLPGQRGVLSEQNAAELSAVQQSSLILTFTATSPGDREPIQELQVKLPAELKKARIYPEQVQLVKGVVATQPQAIPYPAESGPVPAASGNFGPAPAPAPHYGVYKWQSVISVGLAVPTDVDALIKKAREAAKAASPPVSSAAP